MRQLTSTLFCILILATVCQAQTVTLLGLDRFENKRVVALSNRVRSVAGVEVKVGSLPIPRWAFDEGRGQYNASAIVDAVAEKPYLQDTFVVALTSEDLFLSSKPEWRYCFSSYGSDGRIGVFSDFRMNPTNYGASPDPRLAQERLEKMVLSYVGRFVLNKPAGKDPSSLLFQPIMGPADLDRMKFEY